MGFKVEGRGFRSWNATGCVQGVGFHTVVKVHFRQYWQGFYRVIMRFMQFLRVVMA